MKINLEILKKTGILLFVSFVCYYFVLRNIYPGYFAPLVPHHGDFYNLITFLDPWKWNTILLMPRFVGSYIAFSVSQMGLKGDIIFYICLTLINLCLTVYFANGIFKNKGLYWPIIIIYFIFVFSHPGFYYYYTYDDYATISYFFLMITLINWQKLTVSGNNKYLIIAIVSLFLSFFSKETYYITFMMFMIFILLEMHVKKDYVNRKWALILGCCAILFIGLSIAQNHFTNSPWVNLYLGGNNPYFINLNPISIFKTYIYYIKEGISYIDIIVYLLITVIVSINMNLDIYGAILFLILGASVCAPLSVLPNHEFYVYYSSEAAPLFYAFLLACNPERIKEWKEKEIVNKKGNKRRDKSSILKNVRMPIIMILIIIITILSLQVNDKYYYPKYWWSLAQESINRNILMALPLIKKEVSPFENELILGLYVPFHPYESKEFIESYFKDDSTIDWTVVTNDANNKLLSPTQVEDNNNDNIEYVYAEYIDVSNYDHVFLFNEDGNLRDILNRQEIRDYISDKTREDKFDYILDKINTPANWPTYLVIGNSLLKYNNNDKAKEYITKAALLSGNKTLLENIK